MKRLLVLFIVIAGLTKPAFATHQRAGEITYRYISALTYEITIITYSYAPSPADRNELEISWGDGTTSVLVRGNGPAGINPAGTFCDHLGEIVGPDIKRNLYISQHTFPGPASYKISLEDPNRNYGIQNIPNSVDIPLYVETLLTINPFVGPDNSPQLLLPPIDRGCINHPFIHNPGAYDPDGDSLSYKLTVCRGAGGEAIPGYIYPNQVDPNGSSTFAMNPVTGDITWDSPTLQGEYNIAFIIEEWRNGMRIGYVTRDMQITIVTCQNQAPSITPVADTCVQAGDTVNFQVHASDPNLDRMTLTATGAPFLSDESPSSFTIIQDTPGSITGDFSWDTKCSHIKRNPYQVFFKVVDQSNEVNLFDIKSMYIKVVGPKTKNLAATPMGNLIRLAWSPNRCSNATSYRIYRRNGFFGFIPSYCETGIPSYTGYKLIGEIPSSDTSYLDGNQLPGLANGVDYCYMIVAVYPDGAESYASDEVCVRLKKDRPVITNVSIQKTSASDGKVMLAWSKPTEIDINQAPGPYKYLVYRSNDLTGSNFILVDSLSSLNDTVYIDNLVNTLDQPLSYHVDVYNDSPGLRFLIGPSQVASSVYISFEPGDKKLKINFNYSVPWTNSNFVVYKLNQLTQVFDSIAYTSLDYFTDTKLVNGSSYCYKVKSIGSYRTPGITDPLINFSQEACGIPVDNEPPCPPELTVTPDCNNSDNILNWTNPNQTCATDVSKYYIYFRIPQVQDLALLDSVFGAATTTYTHHLSISISGCYTVKAADSVGNISIMSDTVCINSDTCGGYHLPNVFSPNRDGFNDLLIPYPYSSVEKIDLLIFNRWGKLVFRTSDPQVNWDGKILGSNQPASEGVYYYVCDVYELTLNGTRKRTIKGAVTIIR